MQCECMLSSHPVNTDFYHSSAARCRKNGEGAYAGVQQELECVARAAGRRVYETSRAIHSSCTPAAGSAPHGSFPCAPPASRARIRRLDDRQRGQPGR